ncbi:hypothetical protein pEaSNUABM52_00084 [Erwinia phage pEp_SNUABM_52]|nr:hypothetical protein pEaSNUABM52_00084 [Erwinia phage pEp_SNUABM_52]
MFGTEKFALYTLLNNYAGTGMLAFLRSGSSNNVPKTLADLIASSRAVVDMKYMAQTSDSDNNFQRRFSRARGMLPFGGYGAPRTVSVAGVPTKIYAVYPEYTRITNLVGSSKAANLIVAQGALGIELQALTTAWAVGEMVEYDFGRTLKFRSIYALAISGFDALYQDIATGVWTPIVLNTGMTEGLDFSARKIRLVCKSAGQNNVFQFYAEQGTAFTQTPITHAVLVPSTIATSSYITVLSAVDDEYLGMVLDINTDFVLDITQTGKYGHPNISDITIPFIASVGETI